MIDMQRTGFKRKEYKPAKAAPAKPIERRVAPCLFTTRANPKTEPHRNQALLDMARDKLCLLRVPMVCTNEQTTTVACHGNWPDHGKAGARKADDEYSVWGCYACHTWLDTGRESAESKRAIFDKAHQLQVDRWTRISEDPTANPRDQKAARWALDQLTNRETAMK
jgi:hypothetical protein